MTDVRIIRETSMVRCILLNAWAMISQKATKQFFCDVAFVNEIMVWQKPFSLTELLSFLQYSKVFSMGKTGDKLWITSIQIRG
jgi:hypothetical protein